MLNRRKFLTAAGISVLATNEVFANLGQGNPPAVRPLVISTWDFGVAANAAAWEVLSKNGRALDAVEQGVRVPEADPANSSVGFGGLPDRDGKVTLDACIMDELGNCGSVAALEQIMHPISVARLVMEKSPHVMLVGSGALQFALENGFKKQNLLTAESKKSWQEWLKTARYRPIINIENQKTNPSRLPGNQYNHDTIGMVAIDSAGNLAGACTTSGMAYKLHGRVGDSPIIGAGLFVDNEVGAAVATGVGEEVIRNVGSFLVVELMRQGFTPEDACKEALSRIIRKKPETAKNIQVGFVAVNKQGQYGAYALQKGFSYAVCDQTNKELLINSGSFM